MKKPVVAARSHKVRRTHWNWKENAVFPPQHWCNVLFFFNPFVELFVLVVAHQWWNKQKILLLSFYCQLGLYKVCRTVVALKFIDFRATNLSFFKKILFHHNFSKRPLGVRPPYQLCNTTWKNSHVSFSLSPALTSGTWLFWWNSLCPFLRVCFLCGMMFFQRLESRPCFPLKHQRELCKNCVILCPYYGHGFYSERDCMWLFPEDKPLP